MAGLAFPAEMDSGRWGGGLKLALTEVFTAIFDVLGELCRPGEVSTPDYSSNGPVLAGGATSAGLYGKALRLEVEGLFYSVFFRR